MRSLLPGACSLVSPQIGHDRSENICGGNLLNGVLVCPQADGEKTENCNQANRRHPQRERHLHQRKAATIDGCFSLAIDFALARHATELDGDHVGAAKIDDVPMSGLQSHLGHAPQDVGAIDICLSARVKTNGLMKGVALRDKRVERLVERAVGIVAANAVLIIEGGAAGGIREIRPARD